MINAPSFTIEQNLTLEFQFTQQIKSLDAFNDRTRKLNKILDTISAFFTKKKKSKAIPNLNTLNVDDLRFHNQINSALFSLISHVSINNWVISFNLLLNYLHIYPFTSKMI